MSGATVSVPKLQINGGKPSRRWGAGSGENVAVAREKREGGSTVDGFRCILTAESLFKCGFVTRPTSDPNPSVLLLSGDR